MAATEKNAEAKVVHEQFKRNLDHILIDNSAVGPEFTIGGWTLKFRSKVPVRALAKLINTEDRIEGMTAYIRGALVDGQDDALNAIVELTDIEGLSEIVNVLGEAYTSFPAKS